MERRDLLKIGLAVPFIMTSSMARSSGGGGGAIENAARKMWLAYYDKEKKEDEKITNFYIGYHDKFYVTNLTKFALYEDAAANEKPTATSYLRGARRIGKIHAYYKDGIKGGFVSGIYVCPKTMPTVRNLPVLIQAFHNKIPYTMSGSIKLHAVGSRRAKKLPGCSETQRQQMVGNLYQKGNTLVLRPKDIRLGFRLSF